MELGEIEEIELEIATPCTWCNAENKSECWACGGSGLQRDVPDHWVRQVKVMLFGYDVGLPGEIWCETVFPKRNQ